MTNPTINLGSGEWATKDGELLGYSKFPSAGFLPQSFDFTRASTATVVNKQGLIESVASGVPRIDFSNNSNGALLLENQSTNLITYSQDFSQSNWTKLGNNVVTLNNAISPDGTLNASTVTGLDGTGTNDLYIQPTFNTSNKTVTYSVYLKGSGTLRINVSNNIDDNSSKTLTLTNNWKRYFITYSFNASTSTRMVCNLDDLSATATTYEVWGAQLEENSYATSYIPTLTGTTQTRVGETCGGAGSSSSINSEEGVLYAEIAANSNDLTLRHISISNGTINNTIFLKYDNNSNFINASAVVEGVKVVNIYYNLVDITLIKKIAFRYKENDFSLWVNGSEVGTDTNGIVFPVNTLNKLAFDNSSGSQNFYGNTKDLRVYSTALTDEELIYLTGTLGEDYYDNYLEMSNNLNYTIQ